MIRAGVNAALRHTVRARAAPLAWINLDFIRRRYRVGNVVYGSPLHLPGASFTRATTKYAMDKAGRAYQFASGEMAITDRGYLAENGVTNLCLYSRDMTNAAWTATNVTTAQTVTGIDGVANSATRLTATAANGTVLQAITQSSILLLYGCRMRRVTGSGNIDMTLDNGSTWTTKTLTTDWQPFAISQTLANPTIGIRIVTSGDAIEVDANMCNVRFSGSTAYTSMIPTSGSTVTRNTDSYLFKAPYAWIGSPGFIGACTIYAEVNSDAPEPDGASIPIFGMKIADTDYCRLDIAGGGSILRAAVSSASQASITTTVTMPTDGTTYRVAGSFEVNSFQGCNSGTQLGTRDTSGSMPAAMTAMYVGVNDSGGTGSKLYFRRIAVFPFGMTDGELIGLTKAVPLGMQ